MKIIFIQPRISYYNGGGEHYPMDAIIHLAESYPDIHITLLTSQIRLQKTEKYERFCKIKSKNVSVVELALPSSHDFLYDVPAGELRYRWDMESLAFANLALEYINKNNFDIIWTYYLMDFPFKIKTPTVLHLLGYPRVQSEYREALLSQYSCILANSSNVIHKWNEILERPIITHADVLHQGILLLDNIIDPPAFDKNIINIVFAGRLMERKGILLLCEAIKRYRDSSLSTKIMLHICGDGPLKDFIKQFIEKNQLSEWIVFHGHVSNVAAFFQKADFCVFPSFAGEGLMSVVLEAMYYNGAVITTIGNGNEEFIDDGVSGYLIEQNNFEKLYSKILTLVEDKDLITLTKAKAKEVAKKCSWANFCKDFIKISEKVIRDNQT